MPDHVLQPQRGDTARSRRPGARLRPAGHELDAGQPRMVLLDQVTTARGSVTDTPARAFLIRYRGRLWHVHVTEWIGAGQARTLQPANEIALLEQGRIACSARRCRGDGFAVSPWLALAAEAAETHTLFVAQCDGRAVHRQCEGDGAPCDNMFRVVMRRLQEPRESG